MHKQYIKFLYILLLTIQAHRYTINVRIFFPERRNAIIADFQDDFYQIPSIREIKNLSDALKADSLYIHLSNTHIGNLKNLVDRIHQGGKKASVNIELIHGFNLDRNSAPFLKQIFHVDAVMVSNPLWVNYLKRLKLYIIQRVILIDSLALENSMRVVAETSCDAVELRPAAYGIQFIDKFRRERPDLTFFLAGFINSPEIIEQARELQFKGVTLSNKALWYSSKTK